MDLDFLEMGLDFLELDLGFLEMDLDFFELDLDFLKLFVQARILGIPQERAFKLLQLSMLSPLFLNFHPTWERKEKIG